MKHEKKFFSSIRKYPLKKKKKTGKQAKPTENQPVRDASLKSADWIPVGINCTHLKNVKFSSKRLFVVLPLPLGSCVEGRDASDEDHVFLRKEGKCWQVHIPQAVPA